MPPAKAACSSDSAIDELAARLHSYAGTGCAGRDRDSRVGHRSLHNYKRLSRNHSLNYRNRQWQKKRQPGVVIATATARESRRRHDREADRGQPRQQDRQGRSPVHLHRTDGGRRRQRQGRFRLRQGARSAGRDPEVDGTRPQEHDQASTSTTARCGTRSRPATARARVSCSPLRKVPA